MLPEYFTAPLVTLIFYLLVLSLLSSVYVDFIRRKKLGAYNTMVIILLLLLLVLIVIVPFIVFISPTLGLSIWSLSLSLLTLIIFVLVTIAPVLFRKLYIIRALRKAILREYELDGMKVKLYVYTNSHVNALYSLKTRGVYIHEELLRVLSGEELKAIIWHEWGHHEQDIRQPFSRLMIIPLLATSLWILGGPVLAIVAGYLFHTLLVSLMIGVVPSEASKMLSFTTSIYLIASTLSLILTCVTWMQEHSADFYAVGKVGVETFARALVKVYLTGYLYEKAKYVKLEDSTISLRLNRVHHLTWLDVFKELALQTLLARGFVDIVTKPLVETHPPLYLRLRAVGTVFR